MQLEERGYFWLKSGELSDTILAPEYGVAGMLTIGPSGRISVELDGVLGDAAHPWEELPNGGEQLRGKSVEGFLKGDGRHVLLIDIARSAARMGTNLIPHQNITAVYCMIGHARMPQDFSIDVLEIPLDGFEEWLRLGAIKTKTNSDTNAVSVLYEPPTDVSYQLPFGRVEMKHNIFAPRGSFRVNEITLKERAILSVTLKQCATVEEIKTLYDRIQEFFILLTNSEHSLEWPTVNVAARKYLLYTARPQGSSQPVSRAESWTNYLILKEEFGNLLSNWLLLREKAGPGAYLYMGNRRGMELFIEHRFVNLMWGLEALHRRTQENEPSGRILAKVERILSQVDTEKDKLRLSKRLKKRGRTHAGTSRLRADPERALRATR